eukprot:scaffold26965_cov106-Isochrysis_galbana.AAC.7
MPLCRRARKQKGRHRTCGEETEDRLETSLQARPPGVCAWHRRRCQGSRGRRCAVSGVMLENAWPPPRRTVAELRRVAASPP